MQKILFIFLNLSFFIGCTSNSIEKTCAEGNCIDGYGKEFYSNGGSYEGNFKNGEANGQGTAFHANGNILEGLWEDSYLIEGTFFYNNGDQFTGTFEKTPGVDFIYGEYIWKDGQMYVGNWKGTSRHGFGAEYYTNGDVYIGEHKNDYRDGVGIYFEKDGSSEGGFWDKNIINTPIPDFSLDDLFNSSKQQATQEILALLNENISVFELKKKFPNSKTITKSITLKEDSSSQKEKNKPVIQTYNNSYQLNSNSVFVKGNIKDDSKIILFVINGKEVSLDNNGYFDHQVYVPLGESFITLTAIDEWENKSIKQLSVNRTFDKDNLLPQYTAALNPNNLIVKKNKNRFALIIGVNEYETIDNLPSAENDAGFFYDYAINALGIPEDQIVLNINPELKDLYKSINKVQKTLSNESELFVFYAGHGLNYQNENILLPSDFDASVIEQTAIKQSEMLNLLAKTSPKNVIVVLDTCFSGLGREGNQLVDSRFVTIAEPNANIPKNFIIVSSSGGYEWSRNHPEMNHGLFTYYFLEGLEGKADLNYDQSITIKELFDYTRNNVQQFSNFEQNPVISSQVEYLITSWD